MKAELIHFTDVLATADLFASGFELTQKARSYANSSYNEENLKAVIPHDDALQLINECIEKSFMQFEVLYLDESNDHYDFQNGIQFEVNGSLFITIPDGEDDFIFECISNVVELSQKLEKHFRERVQEWADEMQQKEDENNFKESDNAFNLGE